MEREYAVTVVLDDLGSWGVDELRSEYDPDVPAIRINERVMKRLEMIGSAIMNRASTGNPCH